MSDSAERSLQLALRRLWSDHVIWTPGYIVAAIANAPDAQAAAGRLLANQEHIGRAIVPFYGEQAGQALSDLGRDRGHRRRAPGGRGQDRAVRLRHHLVGDPAGSLCDLGQAGAPRPVQLKKDLYPARSVVRAAGPAWMMVWWRRER